MLLDGRNESSIMDVRSCTGADCDCDWDHHLFRINVERKYQITKKNTNTVQDKGSVTLQC